MTEDDVQSRLTSVFHDTRVFVCDINNSSGQSGNGCFGLAVDRTIPVLGETRSQPLAYQLEVGIGIGLATDLPAGDNA